MPANQDTTKIAKSIMLKGKVKYQDNEKRTTLVLHLVGMRLDTKNNEMNRHMQASDIGTQSGKWKLGRGIGQRSEVSRLKNGALDPTFRE